MFSRAKKLLILLIGFILLISLWSVVIEPRLIDEVRYQVGIPHLPQEWEKARIAFISDLQLGMWLGNEDTAKRIINRIINDRPAIVLIGGDFIYHPTEDDPVTEALEEYEEEEAAEVRSTVDRVSKMLSPVVHAGIQVYAVLGNHDYAMETRDSLKLPWVAEILSANLKKIGVQVLHNENVALKRSGVTEIEPSPPLYLVGIGPHYPNEVNVQKAFSGLSETAPRIVLMHNPQPFETIPAGRAPLTLAGHTHGGQIRIPFLASWTWLSIVSDHEVFADGWIREFGRAGNRLYVNRGIGFSILPVRFNCRPELTYFTLTGTDD